MKPYVKNRLWLFAIITLLIIIYKTNFGTLFYKLNQVLSPVTIALLFAWLLLPLKSKLETHFKTSKKAFIKNKAATLAAFGVYIAFLTCIGIFFLYLIPILYDGISNIILKISKHYALISKYLGSDIISEIFKKTNPALYISSAKSTASVIFNAGMSMVVLIYILLEHKELKLFAISAIETVLGTSKTERLLYYTTKTNTIFYKYFLGKAISSLILGIMVTAGFIVLKISYSIFFGALVAVFNLIPIFGAIISVVPIAITAFSDYGLGKAIASVVIVILSQQVENNILTPKIVGNRAGLSGFWVIFSIIVGGGLLGFWGILLCIPTAASIKMIVCESKIRQNKNGLF